MLKMISAMILLVAIVFFSSGSISGCGFAQLETPETTTAIQETIIDDHIVPLAQHSPTFIIPIPDAPGLLKESNDRAFIDYSNKHDGYVMVGFSEDTDRMLNVMITAPGGREYIYELSPGINEVFPLTEGDGLYSIGVFEHLTDTLFEQVLLVSTVVTLSEEFVPFVHPNQYVEFCENSPVTIKATELFLSSNNYFEAVDAIFSFVVNNISYDFEFAEVVEFGHTPDLISVLERGSGICFDIAALTTAMLRSQGIPSKLVFGNCDVPELGYTYHAWVTVYSEEDGMVGDHTFFSGGKWNILDPTLATRLGSIESASFVGDGSIYYAMFYY